jgi:shikimate dehydrogenase
MGVADVMGQARAATGPDVTLVGVIGSPIAHSLTPRLHAAAFRALGLECRSTAFEVVVGEAAAALEAMRQFGIAGLSVTMPHKAAVVDLVDHCSKVARRLQAVNSVENRHGVLYGHNTDGQGFVASLDRGAGFSVSGQRCLVVGAGGAARAVVLALADAGASDVAVVNRTEARAVTAAALAGPVGRVVAAGSPELVEAVAQAHLVVNATPVGMVGSEGGVGEGSGSESGAAPEPAWLVAPDLLHEGQVAADLIYVPRPTAWLVAAAARGAVPVDGLGMLVHQAAAQLALWTGLEPPVDAMWQAVADDTG